MMTTLVLKEKILKKNIASSPLGSQSQNRGKESHEQMI
jgi:hypothetical protein